MRIRNASTDYDARNYVRMVLSQAIMRNSFLGYLELQNILRIRYSAGSVVYKWSERNIEEYRNLH